MSDDLLRFVVCNTCGQSVRCENAQRSLDLPDNGWAIPLKDFGYYGGFSDNDFIFDDNRGDIKDYLVVCHDCVLRLLETFPRLAERIGFGSHSMSGNDERPCCDYAWRTHNGIVEKGKQGEWIPLDTSDLSI